MFAARRKPVAFTWQSEGDHSGDITATFGTGRVFKGEYVQISHDIRTESLDPLWDGWEQPPSKNAWRYWNADSRSEFVRENSGRVLANLHSRRRRVHALPLHAHQPESRHERWRRRPLPALGVRQGNQRGVRSPVLIRSARSAARADTHETDEGAGVDCGSALRCFVVPAGAGRPAGVDGVSLCAGAAGSFSRPGRRISRLGRLRAPIDERAHQRGVRRSCSRCGPRDRARGRGCSCASPSPAFC